METYEFMSDDSFDGYEEYDAALFGAARNQVERTREEES